MAMPTTRAARVIGDQVLRSGSSAGAHYAESCRAKSVADFVSKIGSAMQELEETRYWIDLAVAAGLITARRVSGLLEEADQLMAIFSVMVKRSKAKSSS